MNEKEFEELKLKVEKTSHVLQKLDDNLVKEEIKRSRGLLALSVACICIMAIISWMIWVSVNNNVKLDVGVDNVVEVPPTVEVKPLEAVKVFGQWGLTKTVEKDLIVGVYGIPVGEEKVDGKDLVNVRFLSFRCQGLDQGVKVLNPVTQTYFEVGNVGVSKFVFDGMSTDALNVANYNGIVEKLNHNKVFRVVDVNGKVFDVEATKESGNGLPCGK